MKKPMKSRFTLAVSFVLVVLGILVAAMVVTGIIAVILRHSGVISFGEQLPDGPGRPDGKGFNFFPFNLIAVLGMCVLLGTTFTAFVSRRALNPIRKVIAATKEVAKGNFDVKVDIKTIGELEELSESFNKMTEELSGIETLRTDFINNFSHEFKTPIVSIQGFAKLLRDGDPTPAERAEYLDIIISESDRLAALSTNVLKLSRYETIEIVTEKEDFLLDEQIRRAVLLLEPAWSKKKLTVNLDLAETTFNGNRDMVEQIWINLLDNAVKFSAPGGAIDLELTRDNSGIVFSISDEGCGMDDATREQIFDKFYQGDASHGGAGNGLGLPMVRRIATLCGGTVTAESRIGEGSIFTVKLPG